MIKEMDNDFEIYQIDDDSSDDDDIPKPTDLNDIKLDIAAKSKRTRFVDDQDNSGDKRRRIAAPTNNLDGAIIGLDHIIEIACTA